MKLVILDRDGVVNHDSDTYIKHPDEWQPIEGSLQAIAQLSQAGWRVVIATNQSGIARGLFDLATLGDIHQKMIAAVGRAGGRIDAVFFCPHGPDAGCTCRKPKPGMFQDILARYGASAEDAQCAGDQLRDLQAAHAAGCATTLLLTGKGPRTQAQGGLPGGTRVCADLAAFARVLTE